jgi:hypothetical protein
MTRFLLLLLLFFGVEDVIGFVFLTMIIIDIAAGYGNEFITRTKTTKQKMQIEGFVKGKYLQQTHEMAQT